MGKKLTSNVWVDGKLYGPDGETPDAKVLEQITNEKAFATDEVEVPVHDGSVSQVSGPGAGSDEQAAPETITVTSGASEESAPAKKAAAKKTAAKKSASSSS